ncbi:MAG: Lrp/AsnC family transcriptional regulator [Candidatus Omnitrophica bacterium]|nr:Lrp/AsnC family transcriptional regulator [Candidatus Omnitrophota bacterium]
MDEILTILEKDARVSADDIAKMTNSTAAVVKKKIKKFETEGVIVGYKAMINNELLKDKSQDVYALIEVNVLPQKDQGFDYIAERIYQFSEVVNCYLISGTYDLLLVVRGKDMQTIANFIAEKLSPLPNIRGTVSHFLLKKYKEDGLVLKQRDEGNRINISY